jgi:DNA-binding MarR family transcriptional regulator/N-acetylglutamate synthase-like GNAT family acetyltransferase
MDFIAECGLLALGSRLRRLSDQLMGDGVEIYRSTGHDFNPHWFPTFYALADKGPLAIGRIADAIGVSHVYVLQVVRELERQELARSRPDKADGRVRMVSLTSKGKRLAESFRPVWRDIRAAITEAVAETGDDLLGAISRLESALDRASFRDRFAAIHGGEIEIVGYEPSLARTFREINEEWISAYFEIEPFDQKVLENPEEEIIATGGEIFFAREIRNGNVLGVCALMRHNGYWELAKMGVRESARGRGIGLRLGQTVIDHARRLGISELVLETNSRLKPAISLYAKLGFRQVPSWPHSDFARSDVRMVLQLDSNDRK